MKEKKRRRTSCGIEDNPGQEKKTSQGLRNCPMGQGKVLFKERFYSKKGFIQSQLLLSGMSAMSASSA